MEVGDTQIVYCPVCASPCKLRTNSHTHQKFYGCTQYPKCKGGINVESIKQHNLLQPDIDRMIRELEMDRFMWRDSATYYQDSTKEWTEYQEFIRATYGEEELLDI